MTIPQIYTLEINGRPTLVFEPWDLAEISEFNEDLRSDLSSLTSDGIPICPEDAAISSRPAVPEEIAAFERALKLSPPSDEPTMVFLIKIDGVIAIAVGPEE